MQHPGTVASLGLAGRCGHVLTKEFLIMSHVSSIQRLDLESAASFYGSPVTAGPAAVVSGLEAPAPNPFIGGVEIALLVAMLAGLSLTLCIIAAGAFERIGAIG